MLAGEEDAAQLAEVSKGLLRNKIPSRDGEDPAKTLILRIALARASGC